MSTISRPRVPEGLRDVMKDLTREILKEKPTDIYDYAENYFQTRLPDKDNYEVKNFEPTSKKYDFSYIQNPQRYQVPVALVYSIIPEGLTNLIKDLIKAILREQPENLCDFAVEYFRHLKTASMAVKSKEVSYTAYENYFTSKERFLFTPYVKCTCGRTFGEGFGTSYQLDHLGNIHHHIIDGDESPPYKTETTTTNPEDTNNNSVKTVEEQDSSYSEKYLNSIYVIQRYFRRYLKGKTATTKTNDNASSNHSSMQKNLMTEETAAIIIQRSLRKLFGGSREIGKQSESQSSHQIVPVVVPQLQLNHNENDNISEAASYTSASTALLSASESGRETSEVSTAENILRKVIIEGEEIENEHENTSKFFIKNELTSINDTLEINDNVDEEESRFVIAAKTEVDKTESQENKTTETDIDHSSSKDSDLKNDEFNVQKLSQSNISDHQKEENENNLSEDKHNFEKAEGILEKNVEPSVENKEEDSTINMRSDDTNKLDDKDGKLPKETILNDGTLESKYEFENSQIKSMENEQKLEINELETEIQPKNESPVQLDKQDNKSIATDDEIQRVAKLKDNKKIEVYNNSNESIKPPDEEILNDDETHESISKLNQDIIESCIEIQRKTDTESHLNDKVANDEKILKTKENVNGEIDKAEEKDNKLDESDDGTVGIENQTSDTNSTTTLDEKENVSVNVSIPKNDEEKTIKTNESNENVNETENQEVDNIENEKQLLHDSNLDDIKPLEEIHQENAVEKLDSSVTEKANEEISKGSLGEKLLMPEAEKEILNKLNEEVNVPESGKPKNIDSVDKKETKEDNGEIAEREIEVSKDENVLEDQKSVHNKENYIKLAQEINEPKTEVLENSSGPLEKTELGELDEEASITETNKITNNDENDDQASLTYVDGRENYLTEERTKRSIELQEQEKLERPEHNLEGSAKKLNVAHEVQDAIPDENSISPQDKAVVSNDFKTKESERLNERMENELNYETQIEIPEGKKLENILEKDSNRNTSNEAENEKSISQQNQATVNENTATNENEEEKKQEQNEDKMKTQLNEITTKTTDINLSERLSTDSHFEVNSINDDSNKTEISNDNPVNSSEVLQHASIEKKTSEDTEQIQNELININGLETPKQANMATKLKEDLDLNQSEAKNSDSNSEVKHIGEDSNSNEIENKNPGIDSEELLSNENTKQIQNELQNVDEQNPNNILKSKEPVQNESEIKKCIVESLPDFEEIPPEQQPKDGVSEIEPLIEKSNDDGIEQIKNELEKNNDNNKGEGTSENSNNTEDVSDASSSTDPEKKGKTSIVKDSKEESAEILEQKIEKLTSNNIAKSRNNSETEKVSEQPPQDKLNIAKLKDSETIDNVAELDKQDDNAIVNESNRTKKDESSNDSIVNDSIVEHVKEHDQEELHERSKSLEIDTNENIVSKSEDQDANPIVNNFNAVTLATTEELKQEDKLDELSDSERKAGNDNPDNSESSKQLNTSIRKDSNENIVSMNEEPKIPNNESITMDSNENKPSNSKELGQVQEMELIPRYSNENTSSESAELKQMQKLKLIPKDSNENIPTESEELKWKEIEPIANGPNKITTSESEEEKSTQKIEPITNDSNKHTLPESEELKETHEIEPKYNDVNKNTTSESEELKQTQKIDPNSNDSKKSTTSESEELKQIQKIEDNSNENTVSESEESKQTQKNEDNSNENTDLEIEELTQTQKIDPNSNENTVLESEILKQTHKIDPNANDSKENPTSESENLKQGDNINDHIANVSYDIVVLGNEELVKDTNESILKDSKCEGPKQEDNSFDRHDSDKELKKSNTNDELDKNNASIVNDLNENTISGSENINPEDNLDIQRSISEDTELHHDILVNPNQNEQTRIKRDVEEPSLVDQQFNSNDNENITDVQDSNFSDETLKDPKSDYLTAKDSHNSENNENTTIVQDSNFNNEILKDPTSDKLTAKDSQNSQHNEERCETQTGDDYSSTDEKVQQTNMTNQQFDLMGEAVSDDKYNRDINKVADILETKTDVNDDNFEKPEEDHLAASKESKFNEENMQIKDRTEETNSDSGVTVEIPKSNNLIIENPNILPDHSQLSDQKYDDDSTKIVQDNDEITKKANEILVERLKNLRAQSEETTLSKYQLEENSGYVNKENDIKPTENIAVSENSSNEALGCVKDNSNDKQTNNLEVDDESLVIAKLEKDQKDNLDIPTDIVVDRENTKENEETTLHNNIGNKSPDNLIGNQNFNFGRIRNYNEGLIGSISGQRFAETHLKSFWKEYQMNNAVPISQYGDYGDNELNKNNNNNNNNNKLMNQTLTAGDHKDREIGEQEKLNEIEDAVNETEMKGLNEMKLLNSVESMITNENTSVIMDPEETKSEDINDSKILNNDEINRSIQNNERLPRYFNGLTPATARENLLAKRKICKEPTSFTIPFDKSAKTIVKTLDITNPASEGPEVTSAETDQINSLENGSDNESLLDAETPTKLFRDLNDFEYEIHDIDMDITCTIDEIIRLKNENDSQDENDDNLMEVNEQYTPFLAHLKSENETSCDVNDQDIIDIGELSSATPESMLQTIIELSESETPRPDSKTLICSQYLLQAANDEEDLNNLDKNSDTNTSWTSDSKDAEDNSFVSDEFLADENYQMETTIKKTDDKHTTQGGIYEYANELLSQDERMESSEYEQLVKQAPTPPNDDPFIEDLKENAANKIQRAYRTYQQRKKCITAEDSQEYSDEVIKAQQSFIMAVCTIQRAFRNYQMRKNHMDHLKQIDSNTAQTNYRGNTERPSEISVENNEYAEEVTKAKISLIAAVCTIQKAFRNYQIRKNQDTPLGLPDSNTTQADLDKTTSENNEYTEEIIKAKITFIAAVCTIQRAFRNYQLRVRRLNQDDSNIIDKIEYANIELTPENNEDSAANNSELKHIDDQSKNNQAAIIIQNAVRQYINHKIKFKDDQNSSRIVNKSADDGEDQKALNQEIGGIKTKENNIEKLDHSDTKNNLVLDINPNDEFMQLNNLTESQEIISNDESLKEKSFDENESEITTVTPEIDIEHTVDDHQQNAIKFNNLIGQFINSERQFSDVVNQPYSANQSLDKTNFITPDINEITKIITDFIGSQKKLSNSMILNETPEEPCTENTNNENVEENKNREGINEITTINQTFLNTEKDNNILIEAQDSFNEDTDVIVEKFSHHELNSESNPNKLENEEHTETQNFEHIHLNDIDEKINNEILKSEISSENLTTNEMKSENPYENKTKENLNENHETGLEKNINSETDSNNEENSMLKSMNDELENTKINVKSSPKNDEIENYDLTLDRKELNSTESELAALIIQKYFRSYLQKTKSSNNDENVSESREDMANVIEETPSVNVENLLENNHNSLKSNKNHLESSYLNNLESIADNNDEPIATDSIETTIENVENIIEKEFSSNDLSKESAALVIQKSFRSYLQKKNYPNDKNVSGMNDEIAENTEIPAVNVENNNNSLKSNQNYSLKESDYLNNQERVVENNGDSIATESEETPIENIDPIIENNHNDIISNQKELAASVIQKSFRSYLQSKKNSNKKDHLKNHEDISGNIGENESTVTDVIKNPDENVENLNEINHNGLISNQKEFSSNEELESLEKNNSNEKDYLNNIENITENIDNLKTIDNDAEEIPAENVESLAGDSHKNLKSNQEGLSSTDELAALIIQKSFRSYLQKKKNSNKKDHLKNYEDISGNIGENESAVTDVIKNPDENVENLNEINHNGLISNQKEFSSNEELESLEKNNSNEKDYLNNIENITENIDDLKTIDNDAEKIPAENLESLAGDSHKNLKSNQEGLSSTDELAALIIQKSFRSYLQKKKNPTEYENLSNVRNVIANNGDLEKIANDAIENPIVNVENLIANNHNDLKSNQNESNLSDSSKELAALVIQKSFRSYLNKKKTKDDLDYNERVYFEPTAPLEDDLNSSSSTTLESTSLNRDSEEQAARIIQKALRKFLEQKLKFNSVNDDSSSTMKPHWFVGDERIEAKESLVRSSSEISFDETEAYVELNDNPQYLVDSSSNLEKSDENNISRTPTAQVSNRRNSIVVLSNDKQTNISEELGAGIKAVQVLQKDEANTDASKDCDSKHSSEIETEPLVALHQGNVSSTRNMKIINYNNLIGEFINSERQFSDTVNHQNSMNNSIREVHAHDIDEITKILQEFVDSQKDLNDSMIPYEKLEEPCIKKTISKSIITVDTKDESTKDDDASSSSDIDNDTEDSLSTKTVKLHGPDMAIEKMKLRRDSTTKISSLDKPKDYSFDEPFVGPIDNLDTDEEGIVVNKLQREETRESSAQSDVDVIIGGGGGDTNEDTLNFFNNFDFDTHFPTKGSLKRVYTIAGEADAKALLKNVTIDESIKYIEPPDYEVSSGSLCLDDDTSENIRRKMMAYSLSEADSDLSNPRNSSIEAKSQKYDDFNVSTALVDNGDTSTETESTIVSAVTKIQAGARGYLTRKRLGRTSVTSDYKSMPHDDNSKASFGNAAISESLEHLVQEAAAKRIQKVYRKHYRQKLAQINQQEDSTSPELTRSMESSLAQKRSIMLQRGDALRNDSTPDEGNSSSNGSENGKHKTNMKITEESETLTSSNESKCSDEQQSKIACTEEKPILTKAKTSAISERAKKIEENKKRWLAMRQNSMPVQIDSEVLRVIPKHMRKKIKSADGEKKKGRHRMLKD